MLKELVESGEDIKEVEGEVIEEIVEGVYKVKIGNYKYDVKSIEKLSGKVNLKIISLIEEETCKRKCRVVVGK
jgi:membrane protein implicated in regulation of membrane protease activity